MKTKRGDSVVELDNFKSNLILEIERSIRAKNILSVSKIILPGDEIVIKDLIKRNPHITLNEIWYKLKINKGYTRKPASLYRVLRRIGYYNNPK